MYTVRLSTRRSSPRNRAPLSTERVLQAAIAAADSSGLDALSMRKLAGELGYEVMSLYNHVANKDEILDRILDLVVAEIDQPPADTEWKSAIRASVESAHDVLLRHPWAAGLWWTRQPGLARLAYMESLLRTLREADLPPAVAYHGYHAVLMHILGFTVQEIDLTNDDRPLAERAVEFLSEQSAAEYPYLVEHVRQHVEEPSHEDDFVYVLELILDGLERARTAG